MNTVLRAGALAAGALVLAAGFSVAAPAGVTARAAAATSSCPAAPYGAHYSAPGRGKTVALTFDDGPGRTTAGVLKILAKYRVPATFFNIGQNEAGRASRVKDEVRDGFVVGNHTWNHPDLDLLSAAGQASQLDKTIAGQRAITGTSPCVFRPPYGDYDSTTLRLAQERRMSVWLWSVDTDDWMADGSGASYWVNRIIRLAESEGGVQAHPIVLMHNQASGNPATVSALPAIIRYFRSHGYRFVAL